MDNPILSFLQFRGMRYAVIVKIKRKGIRIMRRRMLLIAVLTAAVLLCTGCGNASRTRSRTVTDMKGRNIVLSGDVTRVVALTAADCEILYAIGAGDAVVARGEYCDYPEAALSLPTVQSGVETNIEQIVARYSFCFGSNPSFFLELFLHWSLVAYWAPTDLGVPPPAPQFKSINSSVLNLLCFPILTSVHDYWKKHSFDYKVLCPQSDISAFE